MTKKEKKFAKIIEGREPYYSFQEISLFLQHYGFTVKNTGSSHFIFRRADFPHITLPSHSDKVKGIYVKNAIKILKNYSILP